MPLSGHERYSMAGRECPSVPCKHLGIGQKGGHGEGKGGNLLTGWSELVLTSCVRLGFVAFGLGN